MFQLQTNFPNIVKILEMIVYSCLYKFFENNKLVYNLQFGFRKKHSTTHAQIHLTKKIWEQLDGGKYGCGIFVDFQKAFDTVDHTILTQKLNYYGVRGKANPWFSSYLKNRKQFVTINGFNQSLKKLTVVSPKGQYQHQASSYEACDCTHMSLHTPKTLQTCKKKHALFD